MRHHPSRHPLLLAKSSVTAVLVALALAALLGACGGGDSDDDSQARSDPDPSTAASATWERIVPGGDCECADGSEFAFWERRADPTKVVFYLDGGGACYDADDLRLHRLGTAARTTLRLEHLRRGSGARRAGSSTSPGPTTRSPTTRFIYVPLCTGDVHLGDVTREYSPELTVEHNGFVNGTAALSYLAEHYPDATQVVVLGKTPARSPPPSTAGSSPTCCPTPRSPCSAASPAHSPTTPISTPRSSVSCGAPTTTCPTGRSTTG